jgi:leucyl aminopeptidase
MSDTMTFETLLITDTGQSATAITLIDEAGFDAWLADQPADARALLLAHRFKGEADSHVILPTGVTADENWFVIAGVRDVAALSPWCLASIAAALPSGLYRLNGAHAGAAALGWLLAHYRFDRYAKGSSEGPRILLTSEPARIEAIVREAKAVALVRDLVNTPALDMGPAQLEAEAAALANAHGAALTVTKGHELETGFPMIHAVGMAAEKARAPRLIELEWGNPANPRLSIIGKGVCFDSGGLDIKPSSGMRLMKKDMGGAAHALALAQLIIEARLPVRLHMLIPAVENAIAGNAFRPGDILISRAGKSVEIANTDAEGRLILADTLTFAMESDPTLIIDFATLTGSARVALGPDLPAMFANDDALANDTLAAGIASGDPMWRLPLHDGYDDMLKSDIADLNNAPDGPFAGAVTAALFLRRFVSGGTPWLHFDTFAWRPSPLPGRPKGGEALGLRAVWALLRQRFG